MNISLYQASVPVYVRQLNGLAAVLQKAIKYCVERKIEPVALLHDRLYPDMFTLLRQIQIACDLVDRGSSRLAGIEPPSREGKEASLEDLSTRVTNTITYVKSIDSKKMEGMENRDITFPVGERKMTLKGSDYLFHFSMPNFYFHVTTAYNILRHNGVQINVTPIVGR